MADVTMTPADLTTAVSTAPNWTDNKTSASSGNNYYIANNGKLGVIAQAGTTSNVTVSTPVTLGGLAVADLTWALADTDIRVFGPFPPQLFNDGQGRLLITVDAATSLYAIRFAS